jgi:hypothetical protein
MKIEANTEVDLSIRQEVPKIAGNHQKLEGGEEGCLHLRAFRETKVLLTP